MIVLASEIRTLKDKDIQVLPRTRADAVSTTDGSTVQNKIDNIPTNLADLNDDATHRLVTDTEKSTWNNKSDFSGSYTDLTNKPSIPIVSSSTSSTSTTTAASSSAVKKAYDLANSKLSEVFYVGSSSPSNTKLLWIDTANGGILKYYYNGSWKNVYSVWA